MLRYLSIILTALVFLGCNDSEEKAVDSTPTGSASTENELRELVKKYPDSISIRSKLVDYFAESGNYENAIRETDIMLQKDSSNPQWWDVKGRLLFLDGDTLSAINAYERAIVLFPNPEYVISIGTLYAQTRNPLALEAANALLQEPRANAGLQAQFIKGLFYTHTGDKLKAISFFDQCIKMDYTFMDAYREKAIALYDQANYNLAIQVLDQATTVKRSYDEAWYWMGRCYQKLNKNKEAAESYRLALQIDPDFIEAKDALAKMGVTQ
ncbi:MAG: tetratricopeptide repeat protein [Ferruginibacter sp.]|nr:tetratricopeptide repeat protein [Ferruginibacter sp.]